MRKIMKLGYALSNAGLMQDVEDAIREDQRRLCVKIIEDDITEKRNAILKQATFFHNKNKKAKMPEIRPEPKGVKGVKILSK